VITVNFKRLNIKPGARILDMGSGPGRHTCAAYGLQKVTAIAADRNFEDLTEARKRLRYHDEMGVHGVGHWALSCADILDLPFKSEHFDLVICSEVMEHIIDDHRAARELIRVLKPGCPLVVSVPRFLPEKICWTLSDEYFNANQGHVRIYKKKKLIDLLQTSGVCICGHHYAHSLHAPYWWLKCLVGPTREDALPVKLYHRFLVWDMMKKPRITRVLNALLNPIMGKSIVLYFVKK
jgi:SAM-dependent methyltransferase